MTSVKLIAIGLSRYLLGLERRLTLHSGNSFRRKMPCPDEATPVIGRPLYRINIKEVFNDGEAKNSESGFTLFFSR